MDLGGESKKKRHSLAVWLINAESRRNDLN